MIAIIDVDITENEVNVILVIPSKYADLTQVFSYYAANILLEYRRHDLQLETTSTISFGPLYNLSQNELEVLQVYTTDNLAKKFI